MLAGANAIYLTNWSCMMEVRSVCEPCLRPLREESLLFVSRGRGRVFLTSFLLPCHNVDLGKPGSLRVLNSCFLRLGIVSPKDQAQNVMLLP
jgi:hypothetical protein